MVVGRSGSVSRHLASGLLMMAAAIFAAANGLGFAYFVPKSVPVPSTLGRQAIPAAQVDMDWRDENLLHLEIGAALLAGAIQSGQTDARTLGEGLDALQVMLDDAKPALSQDLNSRLDEGLNAIRTDMEANDRPSAARRAEALHMMLKTQRAMNAGRD